MHRYTDLRYMQSGNYGTSGCIRYFHNIIYNLYLFKKYLFIFIETALEANLTQSLSCRAGAHLGAKFTASQINRFRFNFFIDANKFVYSRIPFPHKILSSCCTITQRPQFTADGYILLANNVALGRRS